MPFLPSRIRLSSVGERAEYVELAEEHGEVLAELLAPVGVDDRSGVQGGGGAVEGVFGAAEVAADAARGLHGRRVIDHE
jgi:hypothetical protein